MADMLVVGGGVVGLSLAWDLASAGASVTLVDAAEVGRAASWAGAGILPPARAESALHPIESLRGLANRLHAEWATALREMTGIDTGYRRCGGMYVARTAGEEASLIGLKNLFDEEGIVSELLDAAGCSEREPYLTPNPPVRRALWTPEECQLRNPWHLRALRVGCQHLGVRIVEHEPIVGWQHRSGRLIAARSPRQTWYADAFCITAGPWSQRLLEELQLPNGIYPVRGQMVLFRSDRPLVRAIINEGTRYLVPRDDGRLLAGSTEEEVGFDARPTRQQYEDLIAFARSLVPALADVPVEAVWAGLRPASYDGMPYMGRLPGFANGSVASGHFRSGLSLSPAIARVMRDLMLERPSDVNWSMFRVDREGEAADIQGPHGRRPSASASVEDTGRDVEART